MPIELWLEKSDKGRFERVCEGVDLSPYLDSDILTGKLTGNNIGKLSALKKKFVLAIRGKKDYEVTLLNNSAYLGKTSMTTTLNEGILIMGRDEDDFVKRVFSSYYYGQHVDKRTEKDKHLILYHTIK